MRQNFLAQLINETVGRILFPEDYKVYIRDRKGRFAKEPEYIEFYPIIDNRMGVKK